MIFLYIAYRNRQDIQEEQFNQSLKRVHSAPIEHPIVQWIRENLTPISANGNVTYFDFPKEKAERLYGKLSDAHAEKSKDSPRPWKYLPIPDEQNYPYPIAHYEKEYGVIYYDTLYKYITALGIILQIFDFTANQLIVYIQ
ncbi:hypothetical protein SporoP37_15065 [Sporosarcina sp. P37]|uniref:hypothetical protein n=1 Tax=unclassified Sporosarcina TaxID=2647733 RepID=UPI000A17E53C|nr:MULTISPECIES: hypothetical protein [unclassified Sporosarcina]ARK25853.1 hypothetical protein SporoP37_15065 [Sporosarcina sp. P37]PID19123.1 hypothetical protein CSV62_04020 [Sporosarcina sp. P35]